ncbi:MAG: hypothetical protein KBC30_08285 [Planctomycetes bacterium]|nr:hypothetical protein [Planctomycetota bacterium]
MKKILCFLLFCLTCIHAQDYFTDGQVYKEIYRLSLNFQERLYRESYMERNSNDFPMAYFYYGRLMQHMNQKGDKYFEKIVENTKLPLYPQWAKFSLLLINVAENNKKIIEIFEKEKDGGLLAGYLVLSISTLDRNILKPVATRLAQISVQGEYVQDLKAYALGLYNFYHEPSSKHATELLEIKLPSYRQNGNLFFDSLYYFHMSQACFYLYSENPKDVYHHILSLLYQQKINEANTIYRNNMDNLSEDQLICIRTYSGHYSLAENIIKIVDEYLETYRKKEQVLELLHALIYNKQYEIVAMYLPIEWEEDVEYQKELWFLQYQVGDAEMRNLVRQEIDNWWSMYGVADESALSMLRLSLCLLGDTYITPHARRLLSVNNPFYGKEKILTNYPSTQTLRSLILLYVASGRK